MVQPAGRPLVPEFVNPDALSGESTENVAVDPEIETLPTTVVPLSVRRQGTTEATAGCTADGSPVIVSDVALDVPEMALAHLSVHTRP